MTDIESQCLEMFALVYGNPAQTNHELDVMFHQQEPSVIDGWKRLARSLNRVTTPETLKHIASNER